MVIAIKQLFLLKFYRHTFHFFQLSLFFQLYEYSSLLWLAYPYLLPMQKSNIAVQGMYTSLFLIYLIIFLSRENWS